MILLERLTKRCGPPTSVTDVSLKVPAGEVYLLLRPHRAGKTTALSCIASPVSATWGTIWTDGDYTQDDSAVVMPSGVKVHTGEAKVARPFLSLIPEIRSVEVTR